MNKKNVPKTLRELYGQTYERYWRKSLSAKTVSINAEACLKALNEERKPQKIDEKAIDDMLMLFDEQGVSDSTINRRLSVLSKILTFAFDRGYIKRKPKIEYRKEPENRTRFLSTFEEQALLDFYTETQQADLVKLLILAIDTGMRQGELLKVKLSHCKNGLIQLPGHICKSGKPREIPMTDRVKSLIDTIPKTQDKLFEGWTKDRVRHAWDAGRRHLGLQDDKQFVFHALRHTFCSRLVQKGVNLQIVSKLAGHGSLSVTMRYAHLNDQQLRDAISVLN